MTDITPDQLRALAEEAEATRDEPLSENPTRPGLACAKVLSVRLNPEEFDELTRLADDLELPACPGLDPDPPESRRRTSPAATVDRIARDVEQLRRQLVSIPPQAGQAS